MSKRLDRFLVSNNILKEFEEIRAWVEVGGIIPLTNYSTNR
jgi:hypothetical protein